TLHNTRCLQLECTAAFDASDLAETVDRVAERIDNAAEVAFAYGNREHLAGASNGLALCNVGEFTEHNNANLILFKVLGKAQGAVCEAHELVRHDAGETSDVGDTVSSIDNGADLGLLCLLGLVRGRKVFQRIANLIGADAEFCHFVLSCSRRSHGPRGEVAQLRVAGEGRSLACQLQAQVVETRTDAAVDHVFADLDANAADQRGVDDGGYAHRSPGVLLEQARDAALLFPGE